MKSNLKREFAEFFLVLLLHAVLYTLKSKALLPFFILSVHSIAGIFDVKILFVSAVFGTVTSTVFLTGIKLITTVSGLWILFAGIYRIRLLYRNYKLDIGAKVSELNGAIKELNEKIDMYKEKISNAKNSHSWLLTLSSIVQDIGKAETYPEVINILNSIVERECATGIVKVEDVFIRELLKVKKRNIIKDGYFYGAVHGLEGIQDVYKVKSDKRQFLDFLFTVASEKNMEIELNEKLLAESRTDFLTGLYTRGAFLESAREEFLLAKRINSKCVFALLDIDNFKKINDTFGHGKGDEVIETVAGIIKSNIKSVEIAGRLGGEEFGILFLRDEASATQVLEKIRKEVASSTTTTISAGLCGSAGSFEEMYSLSDFRLQLAKRTGKNRVVSEGSFR